MSDIAIVNSNGYMHIGIYVHLYVQTCAHIYMHIGAPVSWAAGPKLAKRGPPATSDAVPVVPWLLGSQRSFFQGFLVLGRSRSHSSLRFVLTCGGLRFVHQL